MNIICLILLLMLIFFVMQTNNTENFDTILKINEKIKLHQCMLALHELLQKYNVWYVIAFGTLLGAVRHHGMIPWDDDIDLLIYRKDMNKLDSVFNELEKLGYKIEKTWKLIRVYADDKFFIDIFLIEDINNTIKRCQITSQICEYPNKKHEWWWKWFDFDSDYLKERKLFRFDGLSLFGPIKASQLLTFWYGADCLTICKTPELVNHGVELVVPEIKMCSNLPKPQLF